MNKLIAFLILFSFTARAENLVIHSLGGSTRNVPAEHDDWCENNSGKSGSGYAFCGVGSGSDESAALEQAFRAALREFEAVCENSTDCNKRPKTVANGRSNCVPNGRATICHRLIYVTYLK